MRSRYELVIDIRRYLNQSLADSKFEMILFSKSCIFQVPFRLVTCELIQDVTLCVLCGPNPSLVELQPMLQKHWKNTLSLMTSAKSIMPRKFPPLQIDKTILG